MLNLHRAIKAQKEYRLKRTMRQQEILEDLKSVVDKIQEDMDSMVKRQSMIAEKRNSTVRTMNLAMVRAMAQLKNKNN